MPHLSAATISNLETGRRDEEGRRRRNITVDELLTLAVALNVAPAHLIVPPKSSSFAITPVFVLDSFRAVQWIRGLFAVTEEPFYFTETPEGDWKMKPSGVIRWTEGHGYLRLSEPPRAEGDESGDVDDG